MDKPWWHSVRIRSDAALSKDDLYRYLLTRVWDRDMAFATWVMLNSSTADARIDDPTILKVMTFSRRMGFGGCRVFNLAAFRATNPKAMMAANDPFGPDNEELITQVVKRAGTVIAAWGANGEIRKWPEQHREKLERIKKSVLDRDWACLGMTKAGEPKHPLYLPYSTELTRLGRSF